MATPSMAGFKPVKFSLGHVLVSGGHVRAPIPVTSKTVSDPNGYADMTFVKMARSEQWLALATTGQKKYSRAWSGRRSLLDDLQAKIRNYKAGWVWSSSCAAMTSGDYEPTMVVEQDQAGSEFSLKINRQGRKRKRSSRNPARDSIATFDMPVRCPEEDPHCTDVRQIRLYVVDRSVVWLHMNDLEWAMRYLYVQNLLKGVPLVPDDSTECDDSTE